jgi:TonB family protein
MEKKPKNFVQQPSFPGGTKALTNFIYSNLKYPKPAAEIDLEGVVFLKYDIDYQGVVTKVEVVKGIGFGCDEEAMRIVKMLRFDVPRNRGLRVIFHKTIRIQFKKAPAPKVEIKTQNPHIQPNYAYTITPKNVEKEAEKKSQTISFTININ